MQLFFTFSIIFSIIVISSIDGKRGGSSGGGGGGSRGAGVGGGSWSGGSRGGGSPVGGGGGFNPGPGRPIGGGGTFSGNSGGFRPASGGFAPAASNRGLSSTSKIVLAGVAGAAIGAGTYGLISSANSRYRSPDTGLTYYYGDRYYSPSRSGIIKCTYIVPENDTKFNLYYDKNNSSKVSEIIYECRLNDQICCGLECCAKQAITTPIKREEKSGMSWWAGLLIAILVIGLIGGIGYCVYSQVRKASVRNESDYNNGQASYTVYPAQQQPQYQQQQTTYVTSHGYDGAAPVYPQQPGVYGEQQPPSYPAATFTPQTYPAGPPVQNYGFNTQSYPKYP